MTPEDRDAQLKRFALNVFRVTDRTIIDHVTADFSAEALAKAWQGGTLLALLKHMGIRPTADHLRDLWGTLELNDEEHGAGHA